MAQKIKTKSQTKKRKYPSREYGHYWSTVRRLMMLVSHIDHADNQGFKVPVYLLKGLDELNNILDKAFDEMEMRYNLAETLPLRLSQYKAFAKLAVKGKWKQKHQLDELKRIFKQHIRNKDSTYNVAWQDFSVTKLDMLLIDTDMILKSKDITDDLLYENLNLSTESRLQSRRKFVDYKKGGLFGDGISVQWDGKLLDDLNKFFTPMPGPDQKK